MNTVNSPQPLDVDIQDFGKYALIIDARSPREYLEDHLPGATNLPVVDNDQYAEVGTLHRHDKHGAYVIGVAYSLVNISRAITSVVRHIPVTKKILVYCFRGGKRSRLWADNLRTIGYKVDVLRGGWKAYRREIVSALETYPRAFNYRVLCGPTGCGKTRLLTALRKNGAQVLDLEMLANHRGSLIGAVPGQQQPSQKYFDSNLIEALRGFSANRPIWVEAESKKIGNIQLPASLLEVMHASTFTRVSAPMAQRVRLWREDYGHFEADPEQFMQKLYPLKQFVGGDEIALWEKLSSEGRMAELFERLMVSHYDPAYLRSSGKFYSNFDQAPELELTCLDESYLDNTAQLLMREVGQ